MQRFSDLAKLFSNRTQKLAVTWQQWLVYQAFFTITFLCIVYLDIALLFVTYDIALKNTKRVFLNHQVTNLNGWLYV